MPTLRTVSRKFPATPLSTHALADQLGIGTPVSVRRLIQQLQPETVILRSGTLGPSTVSGWAELGLSSDGFFSFRGSVHESGLIGHNYTFTVVPDFRDPLDGTGYKFSNSGDVNGTASIDRALGVGTASRDDIWQHDGWDRRVSAHWDGLKRSQLAARLEVSTIGDEVVQFVAEVLVIAGAVVGLGAGGRGAECRWNPYNPATDKGGGMICEWK